MANATPATVKVEVKPAWYSKINWTQAIALAASIGTFFGIDLDSETQAQILTAIVAIQAVATWVLKTWFTDTVTPSSVGK